MTHPNTQLLRTVYEAFGHGDPGPLLGALTEDISWHDSTLGPLAGGYTGQDQVLGFFAKMTDVYGGTLRLELAGILADQDRGVVLTQETGTVGDASLSWTGVHLWDFRDGRLAQFTAYADADYQRFWSGKRRAAAATTPQPR
ncbi:MAG: hypothetical protein JWM19_4267 [Actinomycetia bacterium]|jgi:ketosteroid isomerase-like protein|nr:hypothetical protein [Actinomycetes bacterium]